jgi:hypothetical protein
MAKQYSDEEILAYKDKEATAVQTRYADWLVEKLEIEFPNAKAQAAFYEAIRIGTALRMIFQASPENQEARQEARAERADAKPKKTAKAAKTNEPGDDGEEEDEGTDVGGMKPTKAAAKPGKKTVKAKPVPTSEDEDEDAETVAPAPRKSSPRKASARSGAAAPF